MNREYSTTIYGKIQILFSRAKTATTKRNNRKNRKNTAREIKIENLWHLLQKQCGKCYCKRLRFNQWIPLTKSKDSGKNLSFDGRENFHISLERIDTRKGYTTDNIVFICEELQAPDKSVLVDEKGSSKLQ